MTDLEVDAVAMDAIAGQLRRAASSVDVGRRRGGSVDPRGGRAQPGASGSAEVDAAYADASAAIDRMAEWVGDALEDLAAFVDDAAAAVVAADTDLAA